MRLVLLAALGLHILSGQPTAGPKNPLTVCELVAHREQYADRIVAVRGELRVEPHGLWLSADSDCKNRLVTNGVSWPNTIYLEYPNKASQDSTDHADFDVDWAAEKRVNSIVNQLGFDPKKDRLFETIVGMFRTYLHLENRVNPNLPQGSYLRTLGFGPGGYAPAKLLIKTRLAPAVVRGH